MSEGAWVRFFPSNWLAGTRGLSAAETGIYITLVAMMYEHGDPVPNEPTRLARLCGTTPGSFKTILSTLIAAEKIEMVDGALWNNRVELETNHRREKSTQARETAEKRWQKKQGKQQALDANALPRQSVGNANQSKELELSSLRSESSARPRTSPAVVLQAEVDAMVAQSFVAHCEEKRRPISSQQAEQLVATLREVRALGGNPAAALRLAVKKGWVTLEVEYLRNAGFPFKVAAQQGSEPWADRVAVFRSSGTWGDWGPRPGEHGCRVPPELLTRAA